MSQSHENDSDNTGLTSKATTASIASKASTALSKVLIITYYWPPSGGAGVQRWLRFSKYLPQFGWEPVILTIDPKWATYPVTDSSLEKEVPSTLAVHRTRATDWFRMYSREKSKVPSSGFAKNNENTFKEKLIRFIRGNFFIPDPRRGWNKFAFKKACELLESGGIKNIITSSPPHSTQLIGLKLKKRYPEINWIADLRDPWTDIYYYKQFYPTFIPRKIDLRYERKVLETADRIITVGPSLKTLYGLKAEGITGKIEVITNGYDEDDFKGLSSTTPDQFTISYIGTLSDAYPISGFLEALSSIKQKGFDYVIRFIGTVSQSQKELITSKAGNALVDFIPVVEHKAAIRYLMDASMLLLIIPSGVSNKSIITGKIFEYIASGKPVVCVGPTDGDAAIILRSAGAGETFSDYDVSSIEDYLIKTINKSSNPVQENKLRYTGRELAEKVSQILK